ncbi:hypothetical protein NP511_18460 [Natrinema thermotolerans]|uniref:Uncharacterized protein n=1 Tax=Natrinema thermotolerans TaxID=121872 RepID=A0AAF0P9A9_9EURY|nr:hypothetical protein [Natrinema thermotolerans]QCC60946.1 hypothetical protein DVR14_17510 [Natrinema thermotolerans]QCC61813.1 hypothetical protein DVR14_21640 [Natrinema thermotolerans]WMT07357.1 hypothetical protein NP511_18460 [Natrinema thermotolerans]
MTSDDRYKLFGVYVSPPVFDALETILYEEAGVVDYANYFEPTGSTVPVGDPGADATAQLVADLVADFAGLYDAADFGAARAVDPEAFELAQLAAEPETVARARERFQAAATIQETDSRTVHTAILAAALEGVDGPGE